MLLLKIIWLQLEIRYIIKTVQKQRKKLVDLFLKKKRLWKPNYLGKNHISFQEKKTTKCKETSFINTFMESCSYWKVLPQAHEESFCLLTSQWYYCLIFYPLNEMEKQRKTVQTFSHQDQKRRFSDFIILLSKKYYQCLVLH